MKIIFCGGGTAGHIYPAIAIAEICRHRDIKTELLFIGRCGGDENRPIISSGYSLRELDVSGMPRSLSLAAFRSIKKAVLAIGDAKRIIDDFKPDLVLGTGGYVCWPVIYAAQRMGIPTIIHESNAKPGMVTKILAKSCNAVLLGFESAKESLSRKANTIVVGNPVRSDFASLSTSRARRLLNIPENRFLIVSFGGSLGAKALNDAVIGCMSRYRGARTPIMHIHSCGRRYYDEVMKSVCDTPLELCSLVPYIDDIPIWLTAADLAITRSGAITLAELSTAGTPSILVPSPNVSGNHQYENAAAYRDHGASILIEEKDLSADILYENIVALQRDNSRRRVMAEKSRHFSSPSTSEDIADLIFSIGKKRQSSASQ